MKKLIIRKLYFDISKLFFSILLTFGIIVWTIQAVNYFDFVTEDGHGLSIYLNYTLLNFPKIVYKLLPFIFFISLFLLLVNYESKNELSIFWIYGISKINFVGKILFFSFFLMFFQLLLANIISPNTQFHSRQTLKISNVDFFTSLIKKGKFISVAKDLTIFIDGEKNENLYSDIFIEDNTNDKRMIYAEKGELINDDLNKVFLLYNGRVINFKGSSVDTFNFEIINFDLSKIKSSTITLPKIQEIKTYILIDCLINKRSNIIFNCNEKIYPNIKQELFERIIKPIYIPILALIACFLIINSSIKKNYNKFRNYFFMFGIVVLIISEASVQYFVKSNQISILLITLPLIVFCFMYIKFYRLSKNA